MKLREYIFYQSFLLEDKGQTPPNILLVEAKKISRKLKNFRALWDKYHNQEDKGYLFYNKKTKKFKGKPRTGERFINCVLYQGTRGYSFNSALAICQDICNQKYGNHACVAIANMVRDAYEKKNE